MKTLESWGRLGAAVVIGVAVMAGCGGATDHGDDEFTVEVTEACVGASFTATWSFSGDSYAKGLAVEPVDGPLELAAGASASWWDLDAETNYVKTVSFSCAMEGSATIVAQSFAGSTADPVMAHSHAITCKTCTGPQCDDGTCDPGETPTSCPQDCGTEVNYSEPPTCWPKCIVADDCPGGAAYWDCLSGVCVTAECATSPDCSGAGMGAQCMTVGGRKRCRIPCDTYEATCNDTGKCLLKNDDGAFYCATSTCTTGSDCGGSETACIDGVCGCASSADCSYDSDPVCSNGL